MPNHEAHLNLRLPPHLIMSATAGRMRGITKARKASPVLKDLLLL